VDIQINNGQPSGTIAARKITLSGKVQGVGFRPFIFRLAQQHQLTGWVRNCLGLVEIHAQGDTATLQNFVLDIFQHQPPLAEPVLESDDPVACGEFKSFAILQSDDKGVAHISLPADLYLCNDCLGEMNDPANRRFRYPFINCTQCGPRYTLIRALPYDRARTTMAEFTLCPLCLAEYEDPANRRFHAEPIACPVCGPSLSYHSGDVVINDSEGALQQTLDALRGGKVVAVKGIGGYHLMCDATNHEAVVRLRQRKHRPHKPLAVMFPGTATDPFAQIESCLNVGDQDKAFLIQPSRPILLLTKREPSILAESCSPGLNEVGVMLPYSPLHHLLLNDFHAPLVATSANISGEPVLTDNHDVETRLASMADAFLHHNRPIQRPADDPVYRTIVSTPRPIRTGRGTTPIELKLPFRLSQPVLAVGSQMKNVITLAWDDRAVISPHIGEMQCARTLEVFENTINDLQHLYGIEAQQILCDAHPTYTTSRWAQRQPLPVHRVYHHRAHASAAYYECQTNQAVIAFTWDGIGYGEDGTLWGGETFIGTPGNWLRVASMKPFHLPGGDKAGREPWRSAAALCWQSGIEYTDIPERDLLLSQAWQQRINTPQTSSVGRLFDAAAALTGVCPIASYEGQGAMELEALADYTDHHIALPLTEGEHCLQTDWQPLVNTLQDTSLSVQQRASLFHASLAHAILQQAIHLRNSHSVNDVTLSGGVFQNRVLTEQALSLLANNDFHVHFSAQVPVNDAGISFGQVIEYAYKQGA
jgi:hydrogenase maturation protein HypF